MLAYTVIALNIISKSAKGLPNIKNNLTKLRFRFIMLLTPQYYASRTVLTALNENSTIQAAAKHSPIG